MDEKIVDVNQGRMIDLSIGASVNIVAKLKGKTQKQLEKAAVFCAVVLNPSYFNAVMDNIGDLPDNSFIIHISKDKYDVGYGFDGKTIDFSSYLMPTYTVMVATMGMMDIEVFNDQLEPDTKNKMKAPLYTFQDSGFDGFHTYDFIETFRKYGEWFLVVVNRQTGEERIWRNNASRLVRVDPPDKVLERAKRRH